MLCPKCGNDNNDLNKWCTMCGYNFEENQGNKEIAVVKESSVEGVPEYTAEELASENSIYEQKPTKIKHYMGWSIIAALLGSIVFGIAAVVFSGITKTELAAGDIDKARVYSEHTRLFCLISLSVAIVKVIFIVLTLIIFFTMTEMPLFLY